MNVLRFYRVLGFSGVRYAGTGLVPSVDSGSKP